MLPTAPVTTLALPCPAWPSSHQQASDLRKRIAQDQQRWSDDPTVC
jgi:hypothetical protein